MTRPTVLFAGGGTGGHLYSGTAVAHELKRLAPDIEPVFVGTSGGIEARVIPSEGWRLITLKISGIKGRGPLRGIAGAVKAIRAIIASLGILRREKPAVVVGIGGYASGPTLLAAALARYPTAIIEQNVVPGFTNRLLSRFVRRVYVPSEAAIGHFPASIARKTRVTGNPIRAALVNAAAPGPSHQGQARLLVFGGSQGARRINNAVAEALPDLKKLDVAITHQTGPKDHEAIVKAYEDAGLEARVVPYIDDMGSAYAWADLVLCRAGASTLAEITAIGKPAILVPYPYAIYNHQEHNARALADAGAARWILDAELTGSSLLDLVKQLLTDAETLKEMASSARKAGHPEAAAEIAQELLGMGGTAATSGQSLHEAPRQDGSGGSSAILKSSSYGQPPTPGGQHA